MTTTCAVRELREVRRNCRSLRGGKIIASLSGLVLAVSALAPAQIATREQLKIDGRAEAIECTPFPQYYCYASGKPANPPTAAQIDAFDKEAGDVAEHPPFCTPYPTLTCNARETTQGNPNVISPEEAARYAAINQLCTPFPYWTCYYEVIEKEGLLHPRQPKSAAHPPSKSP